MTKNPRLIAALAVTTALAVGIAVGMLTRGPRQVPEPAAIPAPIDVPSSATATVAEEVFAPDRVSEVVTEDVAYFGEIKGLLARPAGGGKYPGVVMIHEWWGLNDGIRTMARRLAGQGYAVLAVDLYEGKVASTTDEARVYVGALDQKRALKNMAAAKAYLKAAGATKIAGLGWCFGGGQSMQLALAEPLDATVIYYGTLVTDEARLRSVTWPVLGVFGGKDQSIPVEKVNAFDAALDGLKVENEIYIYPDVGHAFANPSGANYAPAETKDAWLKTLDFLNRHLQ